MKYQMRELRGLGDLSALTLILSKIDIKDEIIGMFEGSTQAITIDRMEELKKQYPKDEDLKKAIAKEVDAVIEKRGIRIVANLVDKVMMNISRAEREINALFAQLCGVSVKEIEELGLKEYGELLFAFFKKPELRDFLHLIKSSLQSEDQEETSETASTS